MLGQLSLFHQVEIEEEHSFNGHLSILPRKDYISDVYNYYDKGIAEPYHYHLSDTTQIDFIHTQCPNPYYMIS